MCDVCVSHVFQLGELTEAEDALAEANVLNNYDPEVWAYLSLVCLRTARQLEAEQAYKYAVKVRTSSRVAFPAAMQSSSTPPPPRSFSQLEK